MEKWKKITITAAAVLFVIACLWAIADNIREGAAENRAYREQQAEDAAIDWIKDHPEEALELLDGERCLDRYVQHYIKENYVEILREYEEEAREMFDD